jgi:hypothetical protein
LTSAPLRGQQVVDRVLVRFGGEIVTTLDVREARLLKLVQPEPADDQGYVDAIVNRRLILSDLKRTPTADPSTDAVETAYREWAARLGPGESVEQRLTQAGMTDAAVRGWLRDDLRIQAYTAQRFGARQADLRNWIATLRQRVGLQ